MGSIVFVDTSVIVAILATETDRQHFYRELGLADRRLTSACVRLETSMVLGAKLDIPPDLAEVRYELFLREAEITEVAMPPMIGPLAVGAFLRFGKGRHPARLNFADCLAYACAKAHGARLLYKGDDFSKTDVNDFV